jgi:hypothetical protein
MEGNVFQEQAHYYYGSNMISRLNACIQNTQEAYDVIIITKISAATTVQQL